MSEWLLSAADLARLLDISTRTVTRLHKAGVLPRTERKFDAFEVVPKFIAYVRRGSEGSTTLAEAKLKLVEAQRREIERRNRQAEGRLLDADLVASTVEKAMALVGSQIDGMSGRLANELAAINEPAVIRKVLFDEGRRVRNAGAAELELLAAGRTGAAGAAGKDR